MTTLLLAGDVMLGRGVSQALQRMHPEEAWEDLLPIFRDADAVIVNLESPITHHRRRWSKTPKAFYFRAEPVSAALTLRSAGIRACSLANNHILDFETQGLLDTLNHLRNERIAFAGAGLTLQEARKPALVELPGSKRKLALIAATDNEPAFAANETTAGVNYFPIDLDASSLAWIDAAVDESRRLGASLVILSLHWGPNRVTRPPSVFRRFAYAAIDRGVDVIHGHSAHVFQGIELYRGKPILYDCGDLIDDYVVDPVLRNDWSFLFRLEFEHDTLQEIRLLPVELAYARTRLAKEPARSLILERMIASSGELGTDLEKADGHLRIRLSELRAA